MSRPTRGLEVLSCVQGSALVPCRWEPDAHNTRRRHSQSRSGDRSWTGHCSFVFVIFYKKT